MVTRLRSWWQQIKQHRVAIGVVGIVPAVVIALIIFGYWFDWSGFNGYNKVTIAHITSGPSAGTVTRTEEYQPGKALWDWLQLLIVPAVLAVAGFWLNQVQKSREQRITEKQATLERDLTRDNQQETLLQAYIDKISELLLKEGLRESQLGDEVRKVARVRTLTLLPRLDRKRKRSVLQFLYESGLIGKNKSIISLDGADLSEADLVHANLVGADLGNADLHGAYLSHANLSKADFRGASLYEAYLGGADLRGADLREANLGGAHLGVAFLGGAELSRAELSGADLRGAELVGAYLFGAYLRGADLRGADLSKTNLVFVHLEEADLSRANLKEADIIIETLEKEAKSLQGVTMPDGSIHP